MLTTIFTVHVDIEASPLTLSRTFQFSIQRERDRFMQNPPPGVTVKGFGIDHLLTAKEAEAECAVEVANV